MSTKRKIEFRYKYNKDDIKPETYRYYSYSKQNNKKTEENRVTKNNYKEFNLKKDRKLFTTGQKSYNNTKFYVSNSISRKKLFNAETSLDKCLSLNDVTSNKNIYNQFANNDSSNVISYNKSQKDYFKVTNKEIENQPKNLLTYQNRIKNDIIIRHIPHKENETFVNNHSFISISCFKNKLNQKPINTKFININLDKLELPKNNYAKKSDDITKVEELYKFESKLSLLINNIKNKNNIFQLTLKEIIDTNINSNFLDIIFNIKNNDKNIDLLNANKLFILSFNAINEIIKENKNIQNYINDIYKLLEELYENYLRIFYYLLKFKYINISESSNISYKNLKVIFEQKNIKFNETFFNNIIKRRNINISNSLTNLIKKSMNINKDFFTKTTFYLTNKENFGIKAIKEYCNPYNGINKQIYRQKTYNENNIKKPYLDYKIPGNKKFTLVLDLDETLITNGNHPQGNGILKLRPYLYEFLFKMKTVYEIVVFTAGMQDYADPILDYIEKKGRFFDKRLYREHAIIKEKYYVKDLSKLGRDLSKIIIIDNNLNNFMSQMENGILIKNYYGEENDKVLLELIPILLKIASNSKNDVRKEIKKYKKFIIENIS